jgi:uncharacterized protein (TIGR02246 family)
MNSPSAALAPSPVPSAGTTAPLGERLAATPRLACEALARAINARDLEAALACFAPGAALVGSDGNAAQGEAAIRSRLSGLVSVAARVEIELSGVLIASDTALAHERWTISYGAQRSNAPRSTSPTLVLRLTEGEWRVAIACPWGQPASPPLEAIWP